LRPRPRGRPSGKDLLTSFNAGTRPGFRGCRTVIADLAPRLEKGDALIDGGNSYNIDDIRRAEELKASARAS
jgi:6-phosphogluconate dehydrogenase